MNSVLQCLSNTRIVLEYVLHDEYVGNINTTTSSMHGQLIKGTHLRFACKEKQNKTYRVHSFDLPSTRTAFATVMAELWKQEDDEYLSGAVNPTALKSQVRPLNKKKKVFRFFFFFFMKI